MNLTPIAPLTLATGCGMSAFHMECLRGFRSKTAGSFGINRMLALTFNHASVCACTTEHLRLLCLYRGRERPAKVVKSVLLLLYDRLKPELIINNILLMTVQSKMQYFIYLFIFNTTVFCCHTSDVHILPHICLSVDGWSLLLYSASGKYS